MYKLNRKISNTALSKLDPDLNGTPIKFMKYINRIPEKETEEMRLGKLIHKAILEPEKFNPTVIEMPEPGVKAIIDEYLLDKEATIIEIARKQNYRSNWKEDTINGYVIRNGDEYLTKLELGKEDIMSKETFETIRKAKDAYYSNPAIINILAKKDQTIVTEIPIEWIYRDFECKGILDILASQPFNFSNSTKEFTVIDLKVTTKPIQEYYKMFRQYKTYRQIAFYELGMTQNDIYVSSTVHYIIVISLYDDTPIASPFLITPEYLVRGKQEIDNLFDRLEYHVINNNWEIPREIHEGKLQVLELPSFLKIEETINWSE